MVFKRRDRRSWLRVFGESLWPRGGWGRAAQYVKHRLRRLPDSPHRIARGIFAGVFVSFTPLYGFHFVAAAIVAKAIRGNILASLLSTFFGNPLTFPIIATISLRLGHWMLGTEDGGEAGGTLGSKFSAAFEELWHNFKAMFTPAVAEWDGLSEFYAEVFLPYCVGGLIPGAIIATIAYYVSLPVITAYQNRRRGMLQAKLAELRARAPSPVVKATAKPGRSGASPTS